MRNIVFIDVRKLLPTSSINKTCTSSDGFFPMSADSIITEKYIIRLTSISGHSLFCLVWKGSEPMIAEPKTCQIVLKLFNLC